MPIAFGTVTDFQGYWGQKGQIYFLDDNVNIFGDINMKLDTGSCQLYLAHCYSVQKGLTSLLVSLFQDYYSYQPETWYTVISSLARWIWWMNMAGYQNFIFLAPGSEKNVAADQKEKFPGASWPLKKVAGYPKIYPWRKFGSWKIAGYRKKAGSWYFFLHKALSINQTINQSINQSII